MTAPETSPNAAPAAWAAWTSAAAVGEMLEAYACACDAWTGYVTRLAAARTPLDVLDAGARLSLECVEVCSRVAGQHLREGGVRSPLLNDA